MPDREDERDFCIDCACPRLFRLDDCSPSACPRSPGLLTFYMAETDGPEHFVCRTNYKGNVMKDLSTKAVVTGPQGFYYREEHEWHNLSPEMSAWFLAQQKKITDYIAKASSNAEDDGLVAVLDANFDGVAQPTINVTGISYKELNRFQRFWAALENEVLGKGEEHGRKKDQERHQHKWRK